MGYKEASRQVVALFLVYLSLSGHAMRHDLAKVTSALQSVRDSSFKDEAAGETHVGASTSPEQAEAKFKDLAAKFYENPSMKWSGSGGKIARFWGTSLAKENKERVSEALESGIELLREFPNYQAGNTSELDEEGQSDIAAAWQLQEGMKKWFKNQQRKYPEKTEYHHCSFNIKMVTDTVDMANMADLAPLALESDAPPPAKCLLAEKFHDKLAQKPLWARFILGRTSQGHSIPDDVDEHLNKDGESGSLLDVSNYEALLHTEMGLEEAKAEFWPILIVIFVILLFCAGGGSSSSRDNAREQRVYSRGREIQTAHNRNRGHNGAFMTRRAGRRQARREMRY